jgi:predicted acetyltransferase
MRMDKVDLGFSHLSVPVADVDAFTRACRDLLGWRVGRYAVGVAVNFLEAPSITFENAGTQPLRLTVKSADVLRDALALQNSGLTLPAPSARIQARGKCTELNFCAGTMLEVVEDLPASLELVEPQGRWRASFLESLRDAHAEGRHGDLPPEMDEDAFARYLANLLAQKHEKAPGRVPQTTYWAVCNAAWLGRISVRHELDISLGQRFGQVGYEVAPRFRGRGVAKAMVRAFLPVLSGLGMREALATCDESNIASRRVLEAIGARYKGRFEPAEGSAKLHYVIDVPGASL